MKVVRLNQQQLATVSQPTRQVIALGFFDGVHQGHQRVIARARQLADQRHVPLAVMTFNRHVSRVFNTSRQTDFRYLNTLNQKLALLAQNRVDTTYVVDFDRNFAAIAPEKFVADYLIGLNACVVVGGFDYTFGRGGQANIGDMPRYNHHAFDVAVVAELDNAKQKIGSTQIRRLVKYGQISQANDLLRHHYALAGQLVAAHATDRPVFQPASRLQQLPPCGRYDCQMTGRGVTLAGTLVVTPRCIWMESFDLATTLDLRADGNCTVELALIKQQVVGAQPVLSAHHDLISAI
ncbi:FAD synthetase family protein [Lactiplantibacillus carotarum]|uniref:FAD synthetase family protein n=1 Tax=Lactiplantibacillus carotarum TaxID=2993456 RepID=UPI00298ED33D|nr:FAD synthetase family protein [Lactiplantibacillus carotarum]